MFGISTVVNVHFIILSPLLILEALMRSASPVSRRSRSLSFVAIVLGTGRFPFPTGSVSIVGTSQPGKTSHAVLVLGRFPPHDRLAFAIEGSPNRRLCACCRCREARRGSPRHSLPE